MKILLTAFEPFGGEAVNPALEAVKAVRGAVAGAEIVKLTVPTVFGKSVETVYEAMKRERPDAVLSVGQAAGRAGLSVERVAVNLEDASVADNEGQKPVDTPVVPGGPAAYFATLPVKAMAERINAAGVPAAVSNTAGTFVCNHLMYGVLHRIAREFPGVRAGFIHVPYLPEQTLDKPGAPSLPPEDMVKGLEAALAAIAESE